MDVDFFWERVQHTGLMKKLFQDVIFKSMMLAKHNHLKALFPIDELVQILLHTEMSQQDIADFIGCSRMQVYRIKNRLYKHKLNEGSWEDASSEISDFNLFIFCNRSISS